MKPIYLHFYHKNFEYLSDRSIRQFMKKVAKTVKDAQISQINTFIFSQELEYRYMRSLQDRVENHIQTASAYEVHKIKKGSLTAIFVVGLVLLAATFDTIVTVVDDIEERDRILKSLKKSLKGDWAWNSAQEIAGRLMGAEVGSHVVVDKISFREKNKKIDLDIELMTEVDPNDPPRKAEPTLEMIENNIDQLLKKGRRNKG